MCTPGWRGEVSHAGPLLSGSCEGLLRNGLELERFLTLESSIVRIICAEHKVDLTVQQLIFKSLYLTEKQNSHAKIHALDIFR